MMGALDHRTRQLIVHTSKTKRSADFIGLLERLDDLYRPRPGPSAKQVVIVADNGPIHVSKATTAALSTRAHWLTLELLPKIHARTQRFRTGLARSESSQSRP
jgi:hypothetical protein